MREHINKKQFGLKDYNKTFNKYKGYKPLLVNNFFKDFEEDINDFLKNRLYYAIDSDIHEKENIGYYLFNSINKKLNKKIVNMFKTLVNSVTYDINYNFIKNKLDNPRKNEIRTINIIFYLRYYEQINKVMKSYFSDYLNKYT